MKRHIIILAALFTATVASAQMKLDNDGDIYLGTTSAVKAGNQRITVRSYNGMRWKTTGSRYFSVKPASSGPIFDGTGSKIYLYDRQVGGYMTIHTGDMQVVMQPMLNGNPITSGTEQILNLTPSLRTNGQTETSEPVETDAWGNETVSVNQTIALMVSALQNLQAQADAQQAEIEALRGEAKSKKAGKGQLQGVNSINNEELKMNNELFDLQGRRITEPQKGSIYIQKGKKAKK